MKLSEVNMSICQYVNMSICQYVQVIQELLKTFLLMTEKTGEKLQTTLRSI